MTPRFPGGFLVPSLTALKSLALTRRRARCCVALVAVVGACASAPADAAASFPSTPTLDTFTSDTSLNPNWITPALGDNAMYLGPGPELTGTEAVGSPWAGAVWGNPPTHAALSNPVEVWATINRVGTGAALLYADTAGVGSGVAHPTGGYFAEFAASSRTSTVGTVLAGMVSIWRIDAPNRETRLTFVPSPYDDLHVGDEVGLSITRGVLIAWYRPTAGSWRAAVSIVDRTYTAGSIGIEDIPGPSYGFGAFGGGASSAPTRSAGTTTSITASATSVSTGQRVTYTATVTPKPRVRRGLIVFVDDDDGAVVPGCDGRRLGADGRARCTVVYRNAGRYLVDALYSGSTDGAFAGSTNGPAAAVSVVFYAPPQPGLRVAKQRLVLSVRCPRRSAPCSATASSALALGGGAGRIALGKQSVNVRAGQNGTLAFTLAPRALAAVRSYLRRNRTVNVRLTVYLTVRHRRDTSGTLTFAYSLSRRELSQL